MTLHDIAKYTALFFEVEVDDMLGMSREKDFAVARHVWRVISWIEFGYTPTEIAKFEVGFKGVSKKRDHSVVYRSHKVIIEQQNFRNEYDQCLHYINKQRETIPVKMNEKKQDEGIVRVTQEAFDERFYGHPEKINPRTGNNWFPAFHFLWTVGAPISPFLIKYYKDKGHEADRLMKDAEIIGSYVHNRIEEMGKLDMEISVEQIEKSFPHPKKARRVEECLLGWINFYEEEKPEVISYEQMAVGEDWGGTIDLRARLKRDDYKNVWTIDFKTSKSVFEDHKVQVETYRRVHGDDKAGVLLLGNGTKKKYTFSDVKDKDQDYLYQRFLTAKEHAYVILLKSGQIKPRENDMPDKFSIRNL